LQKKIYNTGVQQELAVKKGEENTADVETWGGKEKNKRVGGGRGKKSNS